jgi:prefoldin subunit 5
MVKSTGNLNPLEKELIPDGEQLTLQLEILPQLVSSIHSLYQKINALENEICTLKNNLK